MVCVSSGVVQTAWLRDSSFYIEVRGAGCHIEWDLLNGGCILYKWSSSSSLSDRSSELPTCRASISPCMWTRSTQVLPRTLWLWSCELIMIDLCKTNSLCKVLLAYVAHLIHFIINCVPWCHCVELPNHDSCPESSPLHEVAVPWFRVIVSVYICSKLGNRGITWNMVQSVSSKQLVILRNKDINKNWVTSVEDRTSGFL